MNVSKKTVGLLMGLALVAGSAVTIGLQTKAQTNNSVTTLADDNTSAPAATSGTATATGQEKGRAPLGGDGNITAINGSTITMQEEASEGGAVFMVDASKATITNNGASAQLSDLKVGDKIFVQGTTTGNNVAATSIFVGHPNGKGRGHAPLGSDGNITAINGSTITMQEEADEGGTVFTVDASKATITNNGAAAQLTDLKVGDKIFVHGTTNGNNVVAASISLGHPGRGFHGWPMMKGIDR
ncbi:MAG: DUF5666 domain-containing protein [Acidobacteriaceae bacterium]